MLKLCYLPGVLLLVFNLCACGQKHNNNVKTNADVHRVANKPVRIDSAKYIPEPIGWTNDFYGLFSTEEVNNLDSLIGAYEN